MKLKRSSFLSKLVVLILLVSVAVTLLTVRGQIQTAQTTLETYQAAVDEQKETNAALEGVIANSDDPDTVLEVAKDKMGLLEDGEVVFYDTTN
ncbi:MAG: septum formation initiator family protein [Clostridiales bacterium]|nr:septum formation initiator family protein [Clostridiales bacterium]